MIIWQLEMFFAWSKTSHTFGVQVCLKYIVYVHICTYIQVFEISLIIYILQKNQAGAPCRWRQGNVPDTSWYSVIPPTSGRLHGVFHCPSCAGRQLPLKGRCPWESSWRIASNICRSSCQKITIMISNDTLVFHKATQCLNTSKIKGDWKRLLPFLWQETQTPALATHCVYIRPLCLESVFR